MPPLDPDDTIAAIASPPGPALRGIVRLSGPKAVEIASARFTPDVPRPPSPRAEHRPGRLAVSGLRAMVPARLIAWPNRSSFTGQPSAELHTLGAPPILEAILADCLASGARLAEPGEFTLRAFLSGRIDLTQAEAVLGVIEARDPAQLQAALAQLGGGVATPIERLRDRLLDVLAHMEANLDFADEPDVDPIGRATLARELDEAANEIQALAERMSARDRPEARPRVVLLGPPNAGKSRLFNALTTGTPALVSPEPGTTRDYLSGTCRCGDLEIELIDTSGVEVARDEIEALAHAARDRQAEAADLLLACLPMDSLDAPPEPAGSGCHWSYSTSALPVPGEHWSSTTSGTRVILVATKSDLVPGSDLGDRVATSAATGEGLGALREAIASALRATASESAVASTSARCRDSLVRAGESLQSAASALTLGGGDELVAIDLRQTLDDLGRVVGSIVTDDVLDRVFRRFCIGK